MQREQPSSTPSGDFALAISFKVVTVYIGTAHTFVKVHQPRNVACPLCGEERFRSSINAVQHVEAGACSRCRGQGNARRQVFDFISRNEATRQFVRGVPQLEYHGGCEQDIPERPYVCQMCSRDFKNMSSLMQHMVSYYYYHAKYNLSFNLSNMDMVTTWHVLSSFASPYLFL